MHKKIKKAFHDTLSKIHILVVKYEQHKTYRSLIIKHKKSKDQVSHD